MLLPIRFSRSEASAQSKRDDLLDETRVGDSGGLRRRCKFLDLRDFRIRVGFQKIQRPVRSQSIIDPRVSVELKNVEDAPAGSHDLTFQCRIQVLRGVLLDPMFALIIRIVLDASGGNGGAPGREVGEFELPNGQDLDSLVPDGAHIDLAPLDILLGDSIGVDALVDKGYTFLQFFRGVYNGGLRDAEG